MDRGSLRFPVRNFIADLRVCAFFRYEVRMGDGQTSGKEQAHSLRAFHCCRADRYLYAGVSKPRIVRLNSCTEGLSRLRSAPKPCGHTYFRSPARTMLCKASKSAQALLFVR